MMITELQQKILEAIDTNGPLTFDEISRATGFRWDDVNDVVRVLTRSGHVHVFSEDNRVRLSVVGRRTIAEAKRA
jgi:DNA-binding Lrp family transcriptional regulator